MRINKHKKNVIKRCAIALHVNGWNLQKIKQLINLK